MKTKRAEWWRWVIYRETRADWTIIATKQAKSTEKQWAIHKEEQILRYLNKHAIDFVPKLVKRPESTASDWSPVQWWFSDWSFSYLWIEWVHFDTYRSGASLTKRKKIVHKLLDCCRKLDTLWVMHWELKDPRSNVLVTPDEQVRIIDFERWSFTKQGPKNLRHLAQRLAKQWYLSRHTLQELATLNTPEETFHYLFTNLSMNITKNPTLNIFLAIWVILWADLITKWIFYTQEYLSSVSFITPILNTWAWWSVPIPLPIIIGLSSILIVWLYFLVDKNNRFERSLLILVGWWALGNLIDRIVFWWVRDFIDLWFRPVFNLADVAISVWSLLFIYYLLLYSRHGK